MEVKFINLNALIAVTVSMINMAKKSLIPGVSFSLKRALGITKMKQKFARETGIPTRRTGLDER